MSDFCRVPELALAEAAESLCRWPNNDVPWTLTALLPGYTEVEMVEMLQPWFSQWTRIKTGYVQSASVARVLVGCRVIDGKNGVLADCYLPCGSVRTVKLQFDMGEDWTPDMLGRVARHEFGHALGLSHAPAGSANWMAPYLNKQDPMGPWDLQEMAKRYTEIIPKPPAPLPPTGGSDMSWIDLLKKIVPILDLLKSPEFLKLLDLIVAIFGSKQTVAAEDLDLLSAAIQNQAQQMRAP